MKYNENNTPEDVFDLLNKNFFFLDEPKKSGGNSKTPWIGDLLYWVGKFIWGYGGAPYDGFFFFHLPSPEAYEYIMPESK